MYSEYRGLLQEEYIPSVRGTHSTVYTQRYSEYRELLQEEYIPYNVHTVHCTN